MPLRNLEERMAKFQVTTPQQSVSICTKTGRRANDEAALWTLRCRGASTHAVRWCIIEYPSSIPRVRNTVRLCCDERTSRSGADGSMCVCVCACACACACACV